MGWWSDRVLPRCVERALSSGQVMELRREVCAGLTGRVLEIGFGREATWLLVRRVGLDGERLVAADAAVIRPSGRDRWRRWGGSASSS